MPVAEQGAKVEAVACEVRDAEGGRRDAVAGDGESGAGDARGIGFMRVEEPEDEVSGRRQVGEVDGDG